MFKGKLFPLLAEHIIDIEDGGYYADNSEIIKLHENNERKGVSFFEAYSTLEATGLSEAQDLTYSR